MKANIVLGIGIFITLFVPLLDIIGAITGKLLVLDVIVFAINGVLGAFGLSLGLSAIYDKKEKKHKNRAFFGMGLCTIFGLFNLYIIVRTILLIFTLQGVI